MDFFCFFNRIHIYADAVAGKGAPLKNCFGFADGTISRICRAVLNERVVYSRHARVHGLEFLSVVL